jgi:hypothetical protein
VITLKEARRLIDAELLHHVLAQGRQHHDDDGEPWWEEEEWDEAIELALRELDREGRDWR